MKSKGIKPPPETMKNKFDMPDFSKLDHKSDTTKSTSLTNEKELQKIIPSLIEFKISNEKKFVIDTEF